MSLLSDLFVKCKAENRAVLIGYLPAGFPSQSESIKIIKAMIEGGVDAVEIGFPYSDPVMDGPIIQEAAEVARQNGISMTKEQNYMALTGLIKTILKRLYGIMGKHR